MALGTHTASIDAVAAVGVVAAGAMSSAVLLDYLPVAAAVGSILVSIVAALYYGIAVYDRIKGGPK